MNLGNTVYALCFLLAVGLVVAGRNADDYNNESPEMFNSQKQYDEIPENELSAANDEKPNAKMIVENYNEETSALVQHDETDPDSVKNKGLCHWGIQAWFKAGYQVRCNCMKCTCKKEGKWDCAFHFAFCPYYYCGNVIYNPEKHVCCCGKVYEKTANWSCCGYVYYNSHISKCCNYYSVKPKKMHCPRDKVE